MTLRCSLLLMFITYLLHAGAQRVEGSWYGRADVSGGGSSSNYLTEFVLKQKGNDIEGIFGYYFKDMYQSFFVRGTYDPKTRQVSIPNLSLMHHGSNTRTGIDCPMHFHGTLMVSRVSSTLKGSFYTEKKYRYTCPELTVNMTLDAHEKDTDSSLRNTVVSTIFWKPAEDDVIVNATQVRSDTNIGVAKTAAEPMQEKPEEHGELVAEFEKRSNSYSKDLVVYDDSILVSFYDNGDIDDDTISVFLNKRPILVRRGLTARALNIYIGLDSTRDVHELSMFADNVGKFPPNTALMVISDRQQRYEVYLSASLKQNASIRLRRPFRR